MIDTEWAEIKKGLTILFFDPFQAVPFPFNGVSSIKTFPVSPKEEEAIADKEAVLRKDELEISRDQNNSIEVTSNITNFTNMS